VNSNFQANYPSGSRLSRQAGGFILRAQIGAQLISTLLGPWLGLYFIYITASLSQSQLTQLILSFAAGLLLVNVAHLVYAVIVTRHIRSYLDHLFKNKPLPEDSGKVRAWNEAIAFPRRFAVSQIIFNYLLIVIPVIVYMRIAQGISTSQIIYLAIGASLSAIVVLIMGFLFLDGRLTSVREHLLPDEASLPEIRITIGQRTRQYFITAAIILIALLGIGTIAYEKILALFVPGADPTPIFNSFRLHLIIMAFVIFALGLYLASRLAQAVGNPTSEIIRIMEQVRHGNYSEKARMLTSDDMARLTIRFNQMIEQLETTQMTLERQVEERTASLEERSKQLKAAAQVAREAASLQDLNTILTLTVNLISEQFGFYHAGIFLLDDAGEYAALQAASSDGGKKMLARGHRLLVGQQGIVGAAAYHRKPRIALDVGADREYFNNPDLPLTRSEVAVPLTVREKVIGVLDIQSTEESRFTSSDIDVLQILADQLALAIQNARLFTESQDAIQRLEVATAENMRRAWRGGQRARNAYRYTAAGLTSAAQGDKKITFTDEAATYLSIPIQMRGQRIGSISLHRKGGSPWTESDRSLVNEVSSQIGLALENARLVQDTQLRAEREQALSQMTARIRETLDLDEVLQTAVREIKQSFNLDKAEVRLQLAEEAKQGSQPRQP